MREVAAAVLELVILLIMRDIASGIVAQDDVVQQIGDGGCAIQAHG